MTERVLGDGAQTCDDEGCETCAELRETATETDSHDAPHEENES